MQAYKISSTAPPRFAAFCRKVGLPVPGEASTVSDGSRTKSRSALAASFQGI
jgi:hypothetical protein